MNKKILIVLSIFLMVFSVVAFGESNQVKFTDVNRLMGVNYFLPDNWETLVDGTKEISHFNYGALSYDPATVMNGQIFEDLTGIRVNQLVVAFDDMAQKITTTILSKSPNPDMFQIERNYVELAKAGMFVNLDDLWTDELWSQYANWVKEDIDVDGHYYAVPQLGQQWAFYYRPSLLKAAGYNNPPKTKDELIKIAQALTHEDIYGYGFAAGDNFSAYESFLSILYMQDGRLLNNGKVEVNTAQTKKALQFLVDMIYKYKVVPMSCVEFKESELGDMFVGGKLAMMGQWDYQYKRAINPEVSNVSDDVGFTVPPSWDSTTEGKTLADYEILAINKFSKNIGACKLFCDYMRSKQAHTNEFLVEGNNTLVKSVYVLTQAKANVDPLYLKTHVLLADKSRRENYENMSAIVDIIGGAVRIALTQEKSIDQVLLDAQKAIDKKMAK